MRLYIMRLTERAGWARAAVCEKSCVTISQLEDILGLKTDTLELYDLSQETLNELVRRANSEDELRSAAEQSMVSDEAYANELEFMRTLAKLEPDEYKFMYSVPPRSTGWYNLNQC